MARKAEAIDVGGYFDEKTDIPEAARTSIISHSLMPMIPSESSICHTNLVTTSMFRTLGWPLINACNTEECAKI